MDKLLLEIEMFYYLDDYRKMISFFLFCLLKFSAI